MARCKIHSVPEFIQDRSLGRAGMPGWIILHHWETLMPLFTDVVVWLPSANVLVMGDLTTNGSYPVIDESSCGYPCAE
jgi:hypothetical protein